MSIHDLRPASQPQAALPKPTAEQIALGAANPQAQNQSITTAAQANKLQDGYKQHRSH
jgi:hypothetical protein